MLFLLRKLPWLLIVLLVQVVASCADTELNPQPLPPGQDPEGDRKGTGGESSDGNNPPAAGGGSSGSSGSSGMAPGDAGAATDASDGGDGGDAGDCGVSD